MPLTLGLTGNLPEIDLFGGRGVSKLVSLLNYLVPVVRKSQNRRYLKSGVCLPSISRCLYSRRKSLT